MVIVERALFLPHAVSYGGDYCRPGVVDWSG